MFLCLIMGGRYGSLLSIRRKQTFSGIFCPTALYQQLFFSTGPSCHWETCRLACATPWWAKGGALARAKLASPLGTGLCAAGEDRGKQGTAPPSTAAGYCFRQQGRLQMTKASQNRDLWGGERDRQAYPGEERCPPTTCC